MYLGQIRGTLKPEDARPNIEALTQLPRLIEQALKTEPVTEEIAKRFYQHRDFLYLGRGINYPIALEGALKLKEISYIHAEGYPAGEMKHGPIALIDEKMPVVAIAPHDAVFEKMIGNIQEAKARGVSVIVLTTEGNDAVKQLLDPAQDYLLTVPLSDPLLTPVLMVVPLQLLAYHIAIRRGCDVDQPRNLAKASRSSNAGGFGGQGGRPELGARSRKSLRQFGEKSTENLPSSPFPSSSAVI
jgi:glucosamine--fructose-6-phosphate aminotransferase (isomerizing)